MKSQSGFNSTDKDNPIANEDLWHWEGNVHEGKYVYCRELQLIEAHSEWRPAPPYLGGMVSPLSERLHVWSAFLGDYPDQEMKSFILKGLSEGFRIGYTQGHRHKSSSHNLLSCAEHPEVVQEYIEKECSLGRVLGPFPQQGTQSVHTSPFGVIPKKAKDKWRLIVDLSSPHGKSINDGIPQELTSLTYVTVDMIANRIMSMGRGTLMAKLDIKSAFRIVPVHPTDRLLLGMQWRGLIYVDAVLPFGLRSAPKLFNAIADAIQFIARSQGVEHITHYLDDYIVLGEANSEQCGRSLHTLVELCQCLGVPLAEEKLEGPATRLDILGITVDTVSMQLSLPEHKIQEILTLLRELQGRKRASKKAIQSLVGKLQHAAKVVRPGRCFVHHIYKLTSEKGGPDQPLRINRRVRSDIQWWLTFMEVWNGISLFWKPRSSTPDVLIWSDASGSWGCVALCDDQWLILQWPQTLKEFGIAQKELIPIVIAGLMWGKQWAGKIVQFKCDNDAVVKILNKLYSDNACLIGYLQCLVFCAAKYGFWFTADHIAGRTNTLADAISRNKVAFFLSQAPSTMKRIPERLPEEEVQLICLQDPDWLCPTWRRLFSTTMERV